MNITDKAVEKLGSPATGYAIHWDDKLAGFGLRVTATGVKAFVLDYRTENQRQRRYTIGRYPDWPTARARKKAENLRSGINDGADPMGEREQRRAEATIEELAERYFSEYAEKEKKPSSLRNDRQMLDNIILPNLGKRAVSAVLSSDINRLHGSLRSTPYRANRVLALLSKMFALAIEWKWRTDNPVHGVKRYDEEKKEVWLSVDQLRDLERALREYHNQEAADAIRLLVVTGSRLGEVLTAEWSQFDLQRGIWTKPSHHTKQKRTEHVPLNRAAMAILASMSKDSKYLFPGKQGCRVTIERPWAQVCKSAGLATPVKVPGRRKKFLTVWKPTIRIHDLRHTFASHLVSSGESLHIVGKLLGHTQSSTTQRYAHVSDKALRDAANRVQLLKGD